MIPEFIYLHDKTDTGEFSKIINVIEKIKRENR